MPGERNKYQEFALGMRRRWTVNSV